MDLQNTVVVLHPIATQGAVNPKGVDLKPAIAKYTKVLEKRLAKKGLDVRRSEDSQGIAGLVVSTQLVRIDPGSAGTRFLFGPLLSMLSGGYAVFEVEGQIGQGSAPLAQIHAIGKDHNSIYENASPAAAVAANRVAREIVKKLRVL